MCQKVKDYGSSTGEEQYCHRKAACAARLSNSIRVIGNSWHGYGFRSLRRFFDGEMVFLVSAKLRERVAPRYNVVISMVCWQSARGIYSKANRIDHGSSINVRCELAVEFYSRMGYTVFERS